MAVVVVAVMVHSRSGSGSGDGNHCLCLDRPLLPDRSPASSLLDGATNIFHDHHCPKMQESILSIKSDPAAPRKTLAPRKLRPTWNLSARWVPKLVPLSPVVPEIWP